MNKDVKQEEAKRVLALVPTKDRYDCLLLTLQAIAMQTVVPNKLIIFDDGEHKDLRDIPLYQNMFDLLNRKKIEWTVLFGDHKGQHYGHQIANSSGYEFVWRIDDDEAPEPDVLERLLAHMAPDVGAVAGSVFMPGERNIINGSNLITDIYHSNNIQWCSYTAGVFEADHLYSSFLYRAGIVQYDLRLSPVAHREETIFTHELKRKGYRLIVDTSIKTYHYRHPTGGIRSNNVPFYFDHDNLIFKEKMESWGIKTISLNTGFGDHLAFLHIVPALEEKYEHIIIGCCYPEVFKDCKKVITIPLNATEKLTDDHVYKWMQDHNHKESIVIAYQRMLGL